MVTEFRFQNIKMVFSSPQLHFFLSSCIRQYIFFTLLFITGLIGLVTRKKYLLLVWTILFVCGYLVLTCITFHDALLREYMEGEYMALVIICCAPFVYYVLPKIKARLAVGLFVVIYLLRLTSIYSSARPYTNRVTLMESINKKMEEKRLTKIIIKEPVPAIDSALIMNWGTPVESIYISKLIGEAPQRTFTFLSVNRLRPNDTMVKDTLLSSSFEKLSIRHLNTYYFQLDTLGPYKVMTYDSLMR